MGAQASNKINLQQQRSNNNNNAALICWPGLTQFSACGFSSQGHVFVVAVVVVAA